MKIYLCVWISFRTVLENVYSVEKITLDEGIADKWKDDGLHHKGADLRFWIPRVIEWDVK